jgi:prephenate dehydrogenase
MAASAPFARLLIVGAGLMGTSVALAAKRRWPTVHVSAIDAAAMTHPPFDRHFGADEALPPFDLAVLATPIDTYPAWMKRLAAEAPGRPVTDVGSVKRAPHAAAVEAGLAPSFAGGHPMAGGSRPGPGAASASLFDGRAWFVTGDGAGPDAQHAARALADGCGARVVEIDAVTHDGIVAAISHLPQVVASVLMETVARAADDAALGAAAGGLRDSTRIAESSARMWQPIVAANADLLAPLVRDTADRLQAVAAALTDADAVNALFAAANAGRRRVPSL